MNCFNYFPVVWFLLFFVISIVLSSSSKSINDFGYCSTDLDCWNSTSLNSRCYSGHCICDFGYRAQNGTCFRISCSNNSDCVKYFYNTECLLDLCVCITGTSLNAYKQTCESNYRFDVVVPIGTLCGIAVISILVYLIVRWRRQRIQENRTRMIITPPPPRPGQITPGQTQPMINPTNPYRNYASQAYLQQQQQPQQPQNTVYPQLPQSAQTPPPYDASIHAAQLLNNPNPPKLKF